MTHLAAVAHTHVIPVDASLTPAQAWGELCNFGRRVTDTGSETWVSVECDGDECRNIAHAGEEV